MIETVLLHTAGTQSSGNAEDDAGNKNNDEGASPSKSAPASVYERTDTGLFSTVVAELCQSADELIQSLYGQYVVKKAVANANEKNKKLLNDAFTRALDGGA